MNNEEKVKFLFEQTCVVISSSIPHMNPHVTLEKHTQRLFDSIYPVLEKKLEEKLASS